MSVFGRFAVAALVLTGSAVAAVVAANNEDVYGGVTGAMGGLAENFVLARTLISGEAHLTDPHLAETDPHLAETDNEARVAKADRSRIEPASVVTHVEVIGGGAKQRIVLLDPSGAEVYAHDPATNTTIVAKDAIIPSITVRDGPDAVAELRVVTAAPAVEAPSELRQALAEGASEPGLFYREDL